MSAEYQSFILDLEQQLTMPQADELRRSMSQLLTDQLAKTQAVIRQGLAPQQFERADAFVRALQAAEKAITTIQPTPLSGISF